MSGCARDDLTWWDAPEGGGSDERVHRLIIKMYIPVLIPRHPVGGLESTLELTYPGHNSEFFCYKFLEMYQDVGFC